MAYKLEGQVLSDEMESLPGVEIKELLGPVFDMTTTDADGNFILTVASPETEISFSLFGYITVIMKAKDFYSYVELTPAVEVSGDKKESNLLLYGALAVSVLTAIYFATKKPAKPQPKQIKIG